MLIDSNILVYSINSSSPKYKKAQQFLQDNLSNLEIAHQNIFETIRVLTHPKFPTPLSVKDALDAIDQILKVANIICPDYKTYQITLELIKKHGLSSDQVFDAYLVATAKVNGVNIIATDNVADFKKFEGIEIVNPF